MKLTASLGISVWKLQGLPNASQRYYTKTQIFLLQLILLLINHLLLTLLLINHLLLILLLIYLPQLQTLLLIGFYLKYTMVLVSGKNGNGLTNLLNVMFNPLLLHPVNEIESPSIIPLLIWPNVLLLSRLSSIA